MGIQTNLTRSLTHSLSLSLSLSLSCFSIDADRFHSDVSGEELLLRQQRYAHKQQIYEHKRVEAAVREEERWKKIEEVKAAEEAYWKEQRALGHKVSAQGRHTLHLALCVFLLSIHVFITPPLFSVFCAQARKNSSCVPYDTVTLKYDEGKGGEELRYQDDLVRYRAALRSQNLMVCGDTRVNYDIINGSGRPPHQPPPMPQPHDIIANQQGR